MLDRKTKNIDASVELLEDRIDDGKNGCFFSLVVGTVALLIGLVYSIFDSNLSQILCFYGLALIVLGCVFRVKIGILSLLIQSKRMMENQQVHTDLLDEILNAMDSLERKINKKAGKKK